MNKVHSSGDAKSQKISVKDKWSGMLRAYPDVIFRIDDSGNIIDMHAPQEILVLPENQFRTNIKEVLTQEQTTECMSHIKAALEDEEDVRTFYHDLNYQNKRYYFEGRIVKNGDHEVLMVARDITIQKKAELVNDILYTIATNSSKEGVSLQEFCAQIESQLVRLMNISEFYISLVEGVDSLAFIHMKDSLYSEKIPFTRRRGNGLSEYIIDHGTSLILKGKQTRLFQKEKDLNIYGNHAKCWMGAPILYNGKTIGVIACQSYTNENQYDQSDLDALTAIGNQIGLWIERKKTEEHQASLINIFNHSLNEIYIFDSKTLLFDYVNDGACKNLGYTTEEMRLLTPIDLQDEFTEDSFRQAIVPLQKGELPIFRFETTHRRKDGSHYPAEVHLQVSDFKGKKTFVAIILDISSRHEADEALRKSETQFRSLAENAPNIVVKLDKKNTVKYINRGIFGFSQDEIIGQDALKFIDPDNSVLVKNNLRQAFKTGQSSTYTTTRKVKGEPLMYLETYVGPLRDNQEKIYASIVIISDITKRKETEIELYKYKLFFSSTMEPMCIANTDAYFEKVNPAFMSTLGYSEEELLSNQFYNFIHPDDIEATNKELDKLTSGFPTIDFINRCRHKDGSYIWLSWVATPDPKTGVLYTSARDITKLKEAETALKENEALLGTIMEHAPNYIVKISKDYLVEYINRVESGFTVTDVIGSSIYNFINPKDHELVKTKIENLFRTGKPDSYKTSTDIEDGGKLYSQTHLGPVCNDANEVISIILIIQDITEQVISEKNTESALEELRIIDKVNRASIENQPPEDLIEMTMEIFQKIPEISGGRFYLYDQNNEKLILKDERLRKNYINNIEKKISMKINAVIPTLSEDSVFHQSVAKHSMIVARTEDEIVKIIADHTENSFLKKFATWAKKLIKINTFLVIPLVTNNQVFGLITLYSENLLEDNLIEKIQRLSNGITASMAMTIAEQENRAFASIVAHSNDAIISVSVNGDILNWNDGAELMLGYEAKEIVGKQVSLLNIPSEKEHSKSIIRKVIKNRKSYLTEAVRMHKSGVIVDVSMSIFPVFDANNNITAISGILRDITNKKVHERALRKSENKLKEALRIARMGSWEWDVQTDHIALSHELGRLCNLERKNGTLTFRHFLATIHPNDIKTVNKAIKQSLETGGAIVLSYRLKNDEKYIEIRSKTLKDENGKVITLQGTAMDITERVEVEKAKEEFTQYLEEKIQERTAALEVSQNESKYQLDTLNAIALVSMTDTNGQITYANDIFCKVSGYSLKELLGNNHRLLKSGKQDNSLFDNMWKTIRAGKVWKGEIINKTKDGSFYWVHTTIVPFFDLNGKIDKYVSVRFDITEQKEQEELLKQSLEKEKELGKLKSRFVSTASHQFRTPMAIIQSNSELLSMIAQQGDDEQKLKFENVTERIKTEVTRMTHLMDEILTLGKINSGKFGVRRESTDLFELCSELIEKYDEIQLDGRSVDFNHTGKRRNVDIDPVLISHSVSNLLSNAFKYSKDKNPGLSLSFENDSTVISISDKGIGIPEIDFDDLFQPFHRAINVGEIPGTGLGLAIVKEYVELNDGVIKVESQINHGSTFTIYLPLKTKSSK